MGTNEKHYNYACMLYPSSVVEDYLSIIEGWHVPAFLSPLHDKDVHDKGEKKGQPKDPHYHLLVMFSNGRYENAVRELFVSIGGVGLEVIKDKAGYARYLCHLDNKDKAQYNPQEVKCFSGADYDMYLNKSVRKTDTYGEIIKYIDECNIRSYAVLLRYAMYNKPMWFNLLCENGLVIKDYIRSNNYDERVSSVPVI